MFRSLVRPAAVGRPGRIALDCVGVLVVGVLCGAAPRSAQAAPAAQAAAPRPTRSCSSDGAMMLNYIKPDKTADFEMVMGKVKEALAKSEKPERKRRRRAGRSSRPT